MPTHCIHYPACGGCAMDSPAAIDKRGRLIAALERAGFANPPAAPLVTTPLRTRRRVDLAFTRAGAEIRLGLHRAGSPEVIDMQDCVLLLPQILNLLPPLRILLRGLQAVRRSASVIINWLDQGADLLLRTDAPFTQPDRRHAIDFARAQNLLRISIALNDAGPEPLAILAPPVITLSGIPVTPPPGAFLQPSAAGEAAIIAAVLAGLPNLTAKSRIAELYSGIGTMTFALAQRARVDSYELSPTATAAQSAAIRANNLSGRITLQTRDLSRRPLQPADLATRAAAILDPPYNGAGMQTRFLAAANIPRVIYISCNPGALTNDIIPLHRAGYKILAATPIDQFPYSENVESVIVFNKSKQ